MGLRIYNKDKILTIDHNYSGVALRRIINASDLSAADDIRCYSDPFNSWNVGTLKTRTISITGDEFRTFAIGPLDDLADKKIQIVKKESGEMYLAYQNESDIEGIKLYTYGYNFPNKSGKCGLRVYNSDGQLTFDSNQKQMIIEASTVNNINTNACFLSNTNLSKKAITISADINVLGTSGKPFVTRVQYYVYIWSNRTHLMAAWFAGLTASAIRNVSIAHMIVDTTYN